MEETSTTKKGLLVMHYGTPATIEDVLPYYTHIRRGRPPAPEQLQDLVDRYQAIGGPSPLTEISERQAAAIGEGLRRRGIESKVYIGTKHTHPFVAEAVERMAHDGVEEAVGVVLAPHFSTFSIAAYKKYAEEAREQHSPEMSLTIIERWGTLPALVDFLSRQVAVQLEGWDPEETLVIFSAHSLPSKIVAAGDPYKDELLETSRLVAEKAALPHWAFAFQSASNTGEPWLGPDILDVIEEAGRSKAYKNVVSCTVGFVSDHLEVLYDLGIEAKEKCAEVGLGFRLTACVNDDPAVMDALSGLAASAFHERAASS
jgi:ferrochelatase